MGEPGASSGESGLGERRRTSAAAAMTTGGSGRRGLRGLRRRGEGAGVAGTPTEFGLGMGSGDILGCTRATGVAEPDDDETAIEGERSRGAIIRNGSGEAWSRSCAYESQICLARLRCQGKKAGHRQMAWICAMSGAIGAGAPDARAT